MPFRVRKDFLESAWRPPIDHTWLYRTGAKEPSGRNARLAIARGSRPWLSHDTGRRREFNINNARLLKSSFTSVWRIALRRGYSIPPKSNETVCA